MVITQSDKPASVTKSRGFDYQVGSGEMASSKPAQFDFTFNVTPSVQEEEKVAMQVSLNVTIPNGQSYQGTPDRTTNNVTTNVIVKSKESAVIGGVVQNSAQTAYDK